MKVYILGGSGSGKTTLARKIAREYGIPTHSLDSKKARDILLKEIIFEKDWIIEGVYVDQQFDEAFNHADFIFYLTTPWKVQRRRIIRRFLKRKLGIDKTEKGVNDETLKSVAHLLKSAKRYAKNDEVKMKEKLLPYKEKLYEVKDYDEVRFIIR